jgi:hypothetical protein
MRALLAIAVACLVWSSVAAAATKPVLPKSWPVIQLDRSKTKDGQSSCSAGTRDKIAGQKRKALPVACEQPPRSKVRDAGFVIVLAP